MANVYRRAAGILERASSNRFALIGCCEAISDAEYFGAAVPVRANELFSEWFKPDYMPYSSYWWPLDLEHVLPRLIALDLMALIAEDGDG